MIIDCHGHMVTPSELVLYREFLIGSRGHYGPRIEHVGVGTSRQKGGRPVRSGTIPDELLRAAAEEHIGWLDVVGTDMQLISARPYNLMHSEKPTKIIHWWIEALNDAISTQVHFFPERLAGMVNLPQVYGEPVSVCFDELDRRMQDPAFVGVLVNPDPSEGRGYVPGLGDEYWFPLYEKLVHYDVPMHIHSAGCVSDRESQSLHFINEESVAVMSLIDGNVWATFPDLKVVVAHGGGAIPYQVGRFRHAYWGNRGIPGTFDENLRKLYFDSCLYTEDAVELLIKTVGADRVVLGTERPGDGSLLDPSKEHTDDDIKHVLENFSWLAAEDRALILGATAEKIFTRLGNQRAALAPAKTATGNDSSAT